MSRPIRLLTLTTLYPNSLNPRHGVFIANRLQRLRNTGRVEADVVAALPAFPFFYAANRHVPRIETVNGQMVVHPRYFNVPRIGMRAQPYMLWMALRKALRETPSSANYDVVDAHYFYPDGVAAMRIADELGLPLVVSARGSDINRIGEISFARKQMLEVAKRAQAIIAVSSALAKRMCDIGMPRDRIHVLRNGVDAEMFRPVPRSDARRFLNIDQEGTWILAVGNLVPEKGHELLIDAVALLPGVRLLIVGEGNACRHLMARAEASMPGRALFKPHFSQQDLPFVYSACEVFAHPSLREGWPNVLLEAMACGLPIVASPVGGVPEILASGTPGKLVGEREPRVWAEALQAMLAQRIAPEVPRKYALQFGWGEIVDRQCDLYTAIAAANRAREPNG